MRSSLGFPSCFRIPLSQSAYLPSIWHSYTALNLAIKVIHTHARGPSHIHSINILDTAFLYLLGPIDFDFSLDRALQPSGIMVRVIFLGLLYFRDAA